MSWRYKAACFCPGLKDNVWRVIVGKQKVSAKEQEGNKMLFQTSQLCYSSHYKRRGNKTKLVL